MVKLMGDHDFADRENLKADIFEWVTKMKSWCNGTFDFISDLDAGVQPVFKELVRLIDQRQKLTDEFQEFKASQEIRIQEVEKGYNAMLSRQEVQSTKKGDSEEIIEKKQNLLKGWKQDKMETIERETGTKESEIEKLTHAINSKMDAVIDFAQLDPMDHDPVHQGADDAIMAELEELMNGVSITDGTTVQHQKTLMLGETGSGGDATMEKPVVSLFQDAQSPVSSQQDRCMDAGVTPGSTNTPVATQQVTPSSPAEEIQVQPSQQSPPQNGGAVQGALQVFQRRDTTQLQAWRG